MPKTPVSPSKETELVTAGQPSAALLAKLKAVGAKVTDEQILASVTRAEDARSRFYHSAVETGLLLLAKKQTVKHGQWGKWCDAFTTKLAAAANLTGESGRTFRDYTFIAQHFLADLEQGIEEFRVLDPKLPAKINPADVLAMDTLPELRREAVSRQIHHWVRGRSLRQMLADLRRADNAAAEEETTENPPKAQKTIASTQSAYDAASVPPPCALGAEQLELWRDFALPLHTLDTYLNDDSAWLGTDKTLWKAVVMSLEARLQTARDRLKNTL